MSRPPRQDHRLTKVLAALRTQGGAGRSPLYRWMYRHHDALAAAFAETPPAWEPLATALAATGLTGIDGTPPSAGRAKQTWYRVRRDVARVRSQSGAEAPAPALAPDEIAPAVHAVPPPAAPDPVTSARPRMALDIRPARAATGETPTAAPPAMPAASDVAAAPGAAAMDAAVAPGATPATPATETAADQLRRLFATIDARKVPLPKVM